MLRFVLESLGATVNYNSITKEITIDSIDNQISVVDTSNTSNDKILFNGSNVAEYKDIVDLGCELYMFKDGETGKAVILNLDGSLKYNTEYKTIELLYKGIYLGFYENDISKDYPDIIDNNNKVLASNVLSSSIKIDKEKEEINYNSDGYNGIISAKNY